MSREYPDWIDPWKAAEGRRTFSGSMPMSRMKRLMILLDPPAGEARFSARFGFDEQRQVVIRIEVDAELPLICQRSLERYLEPVHRQAVLGVLATLAEESVLPGHYEPVLAEHGRLALQDLVEDELILGVPQVPRDPGVAEVRLTCAGPDDAEAAEAQAAEKSKPFAGLADEMKKRAGRRNKDR